MPPIYCNILQLQWVACQVQGLRCLRLQLGHGEPDPGSQATNHRMSKPTYVVEREMGTLRRRRKAIIR